MSFLEGNDLASSMAEPDVPEGALGGSQDTLSFPVLPAEISCSTRCDDQSGVDLVPT